MGELTVITNKVPRPVLDAWELSAEERAEFDYLDWEALERGEDSASFIRYKGEIYDLGEFEVWTNPESPLNVGGWDAFRSDTFFSGLLVRYTNDFEEVIVGRYFS